MKLELDLKNRRQLETMRTELKTALETVEFVLSKLQDGEESLDLAFAEIDAALAQPADGTPVSAEIETAIKAMASRFKSSDVYNNLPHVARTAIKDAFRRMVDAGRLKIVEQGMGQRPTVYQKTNDFDKNETVEVEL